MNKSEHRQGTNKKTSKKHTLQYRNSLALPEHTKNIAQRLQRMNAIFGQLFSDENFVTLLRAESLTSIPIYLKPVLQDARGRDETGHEIV
jgi:hypothetical protein